MSHLTKVITNLNPSECALFRASYGNPEIPPLTLELFNILRDTPEIKPKELAQRLYKGGKQVPSPRTISDTLEKEIDQYIMLQRMKVDATGASEMTGNLCIAFFWCEKNAIEVASKYLLAAQKTGIEHKQFTLLETVYKLLYTYAKPLGLNTDDILSKWKENSDNLENEREILFALHTTGNKVDIAKQAADGVDPDAIMDYILTSFDLPEHEDDDPAFMFAFSVMIRSAMLSGKQYLSLQKFLKKNYTRLKDNNAFTRAHQQHEQGLLYMLAHAYHRCIKFNKANEYLEVIRKLMPTEVFRTSPYYGKCRVLEAMSIFYTGDVNEATAMLEKILDKEIHHLDQKDINNALLNLAVCYFSLGKFGSAIRRLERIKMPKKELEKLMGLEWCLKFDMISMFCQHCNANEQALYQNAVIMKYYKKMMDKKNYQRVLPFLECIRMIMQDATVVSTKKFIEKVKKIEKARGGAIEDLHALTFFAWIISVMENKSFYVVLMDKVNWIRKNVSGDL